MLAIFQWVHYGHFGNFLKQMLFGHLAMFQIKCIRILMAIIQNRGNMVFFGGKIEALYSVWYRTIYQYKDLLAFWKRPGHFGNIS